MTHGSLFNGIGGFQIASSAMNWKNVFSCEIDEFCSIITKYHFPNCKQYYDIKKTSFKKYKGKIDILTGGFPCQPFSVAGKRLGTADNRNLWTEMYRAIKEIQPRWIVSENVYGIISWGKGLVFEQVQANLETAGYEVQSFVLPASGVNAPHQRHRVFFVAHNPNARIKNMQLQRTNGVHGFEFTADPDSLRKHKSKQKKQSKFTVQNGTEYTLTDWENFPTQSPLYCRDDGLPAKLDAITFSSWRRQSIKAYGNAVVPQLVLQIFKTINAIEKKNE